MTVISIECSGPLMTRFSIVAIAALVLLSAMAMPVQAQEEESVESESNVCLLYTSDAADE